MAAALTHGSVACSPVSLWSTPAVSFAHTVVVMVVWLERGCKKDLKYVRMVCILAAVKCLSGRLVVVRDGTQRLQQWVGLCIEQ